MLPRVSSEALQDPTVQKKGLDITFFASLLYSITNTARSSNLSVSLNEPKSPLLAVQVRLLRPCRP
jgi:hypothetical protein